MHAARASRGGRVLAQWGTARCAPCPWTRDVRPGATGDVLPTAPAQRCNAPAGLDGDPPSRPSAPSGPRGLIRRCEKRVERSGRQTGHGPAVSARTRHRHGALDEAALARHTQCRVMKKRVQRRTADIAAARAGAALVLQRIQKRPAHRRIEIAQRQRRRRCPPPLLGKVPPPAAGGAVAGDRVGTGVVLAQAPCGATGCSHGWQGAVRGQNGRRLCACSRRWVPTARNAGVVLRDQ